MPRDASGNYTLPGGNPVVTGTVITSTWANPTMADIGNELTNSLSRDGQGGMRAPLLFADGSFNAPSITFVQQPTLGIYRNGSSILGIAGQGQNIALFNGATGNVTVTNQTRSNAVAPADASDLTRKDYVDGELDALAESLQDQIDAIIDTSAPIGTIVFFNAAFAAIPSNWQLCNGTNGTPNMTNRFVYGTNTEGQLGDTGGSANAVLVSHTHTAQAAADHVHNTLGSTNESGSTNVPVAGGGGGTAQNWNTQPAGAHTHTINAAGVSGTNANLPPYVKLAYIQRMS